MCSLETRTSAFAVRAMHGRIKPSELVMTVKAAGEKSAGFGEGKEKEKRKIKDVGYVEGSSAL